MCQGWSLILAASRPYATVEVFVHELMNSDQLEVLQCREQFCSGFGSERLDIGLFEDCRGLGTRLARETGFDESQREFHGYFQSSKNKACRVSAIRGNKAVALCKAGMSTSMPLLSLSHFSTARSIWDDALRRLIVACLIRGHSAIVEEIMKSFNRCRKIREAQKSSPVEPTKNLAQNNVRASGASDRLSYDTRFSNGVSLVSQVRGVERPGQWDC
jgi:hypothetical protein